MGVLTEQEIHNLGMNFIGRELQKMGYEFLGVNSNLKKHPQFVTYKKGEGTTFVMVKTIAFPNTNNLFDESLIEKVKQHAISNNAKMWTAKVNVANAYNLLEPITTEQDYTIQFLGFNKII